MDESLIEQTKNEINILKMCQHPNIMGFYEVFENSDHIFLVLEYLSGGNLFTYINEHNFSITENNARRYITSITKAINYMHMYGIIHRDIKPENIILEDNKDDSQVKIGDFGFAKMLRPDTLATDTVGTLCYVAPEILLGSKYGMSVDMWSLGVMTYLLLTGYMPFNINLSDKGIIK